MIRVVIVEDEMLVRLGLKACLESNENISVPGTFATAEEAETFLRAEDADLLLTDIRLPGISGLELLQRVKAKRPEIKVIVLTCYEDFNYARSALEYGASRYLLKHELNEQELCRLIIELAGDPKSEKKRMVTYGNNYAVEKLCEKNTRVMIFTFRGTGESTNATGEELKYDMLAELLNTSLSDHELGHCVFWQGNILMGILPEGTELPARLLVWFREISDTLRLYTDKNCFAGVSDVFSKAGNLPEAIAKAMERCSLSFFYEKSMLFLSKNAENRSCPVLMFQKTDAFTEKWLNATETNTEIFFRVCRSEKPETDKIKETVVRFLHTMLDHGEQYYSLRTEDVFYTDALPGYQYVNRFDSLEALKNWFVETLRRTVNYISTRESLTASIKLYLEQNYADPALCQSDIAEHFHMSNPYFSQYFKEHFGVNYVQYLNEMRIAQAKLLLRNTNDSTEIIAEKIGIDNVNYFFRLFKKKEGMTVLQYRKEKRE